MKAVNVIVKVVLALAAVAGIVYLAATYGDKIVAWAKKLLNRGCCCCEEDCECECDCECDCQCDCCEEEIAEEAAEEAPVAAEQDFEG